MEVAEYLRKSRMEEDMDTEEVLSRHRKALAEYAERHNLHIIETYYEVKSGESLYARPEAMRLLEDVEAGMYEAVLVMDLDRLSRGRMKDQGIILDAFRESGTLIITPEKTYDLNDDLDDEMAEFKTFMSRREYKIINKRLRRGLKQSIMDGCYVSNAPYGYRNIYVDRRPTLEIYEPEAKFVRMIFDLYLKGYGCIAIAREIGLLGARPHRSNAFNKSSIAHIIRNPTYTGKIVWNQKQHIKKSSHGNPKNIVLYNSRDKWIITDGLHPAIISQESYDQAQAIMEGRYHPSRNDGTVKSSLAGLVKCSKCGRNMQRLYSHNKRDEKIPYLTCITAGCCAAVKFEFAEKAVISHLESELKRLELQKQNPYRTDTDPLEATMTALEKELTTATRQKAKLYELLEIGEYDLSTFRERMAAVKEKIGKLESKRTSTKAALEAALHTDERAQEKKIRAVLDVYEGSDPAHRNALLKSVIDVILYTKEKKTKPMDFKIEVKLKPN